MKASEFSTSINFLLISPFIPLLNSFTNGLPSYPLSLAVLLNSCTNYSIIFFLCSSFLNSATLTDSSSPLLNFFFKLIKNSSTVSYLISPASDSSITFSFHTSAVPPCTYDNIHCTCPSTDSPLNLILIYSLHATINPPTFANVPSKI